MAGLYLCPRVEFGPAVGGACGAPVDWLALETLGFQELACGWARHPPHWQGFRVRTEQGMGCV